MDSKKQGMKALRLYHKCASVTKTIQTLGFPGRETLYPLEKSGDGKKLRDHPDRLPQRMCQLSIYPLKRRKMQ
ncbi:hypothetical protein GCWU000341_00965 [Oribacterium sp. oral taxon 078 str. F0262]|nr:hypothetical protein GCWU000341_00965 [Oribacterium sp. oral taxon 078 str. F0262]